MPKLMNTFLLAQFVFVSYEPEIILKEMLDIKKQRRYKTTVDK